MEEERGRWWRLVRVEEDGGGKKDMMADRRRWRRIEGDGGDWRNMLEDVLHYYIKGDRGDWRRIEKDRGGYMKMK